MKSNLSNKAYWNANLKILAMLLSIWSMLRRYDKSCSADDVWPGGRVASSRGLWRPSCTLPTVPNVLDSKAQDLSAFTMLKPSVADVDGDGGARTELSTSTHGAQHQNNAHTLVSLASVDLHTPMHIHQFQSLIATCTTTAVHMPYRS